MAKEEKKTNVLSMVGFWAFIVGLILALVVGIMAGIGIAPAALMTVIIIILVLLGLIIGFLNITASEIILFLVATIALIVVGNAFTPLVALKIGVVVDIIGSILSLIGVLMAPAAIIAAIKALWKVGKPGD